MDCNLSNSKNILSYIKRSGKDEFSKGLSAVARFQFILAKYESYSPEISSNLSIFKCHFQPV